MKKSFFILSVLMSCAVYAQPGKNVPKKTPAPTQTIPVQKPVVKQSGTTASNIITLTVSPETVSCTDNPGAQCLQIKRQGSTEYETVDDIEKFNYEIGYSYTIQVKEMMKTPPVKSGESIYRYIWIKTLNRKEVTESVAEESIETTRTNNGTIIGKTEIFTTSTIDGRWYLRKMIDIDNTSLVIDDNVMNIDIKTFNDRIDGFGSCNKFATVLQSDRKTTFFVSKLTTDNNYCGYKKLEDQFYNVLQQVDKFEIRNDGNLILSKQWSFQLGFTKNPDNKEEISITYTPPAIVKNDNKTYATNENLNTTTNKTEESQTYVKNNVTPKETNISDETEADDYQKQIDELKKKQAEKKAALQKATDDAKKAAEAKLISDKEAELKKKEELKQQDLAATQAAEQAKLAAAKAERVAKLKSEKERMEKELEEMENETEIKTVSKPIETTTKKATEKNNKPIITEKPFEPTSSFKSKETITTKASSNLDFPEPKNAGIVYSLDEKKITSLENANATFKGNDKNTYLELETEESSIQFTQNKLPKLIIKLNDNESPYGNVLLYICDFKKDKRQVLIRPKKNTIGLSFNELSKSIYEILLPKNMEENEYAFVTNANTNNFKDLEYNSTSTSISCFGITKNSLTKNEEVEVVKNTKVKDKKEDKSNDCKPDNIQIDKITKEKTESWNLKLASSNVFVDKANGKDQFIFYFQLYKIGNKQYFALVLQKTASMNSQLLGNEYVFDKGNKVLFGLVDSKPYEMIITDVYKDKKIYEASHQVVTTHFLAHEITDEEIPNVKDLLTNKNIDAIRIILSDGTFINKDVKEKKSDELIYKAKCFFDALE